MVLLEPLRELLFPPQHAQTVCTQHKSYHLCGVISEVFKQTLDSNPHARKTDPFGDAVQAWVSECHPKSPVAKGEPATGVKAPLEPTEKEEGLWTSGFRIDSPKFSRAFGDGLSRLVHQRAARKPISDARTATYVILSTGSGPGGRWFKSIRPDQSFRINDLYHTKIRGAPGCGLGHSIFKSFARNQSFSSEFSVLRREVHPHGESWFGEIKYKIAFFGTKIKTASSSPAPSMVKSRPSGVLAQPPRSPYKGSRSKPIALPNLVA